MAILKGTKFTEEHKRRISEALKGNPKVRRGGEYNPMFGKTHNEKTKKRWSLIRKGKKLSKEVKEKMKLSHTGKPLNQMGHRTNCICLSCKAKRGELRGKNNPMWKGGITEKDSLDRSKFRKTIQEKVFKRDSYTCQICNHYGGNLQVDHIQPWAEYVKLRFSINNCRTLCMDCHYKITYGKPKPENIKTWGHNYKKVSKRLASTY